MLVHNVLLRLPNPDDPSDVRYLFWSENVSAPLTYGMTLEELKRFTKEQGGIDGLEVLRHKLTRADQTGTSSLIYESWRDALEINEAGPGGKRIGHRELWERYVMNREGPFYC